jgi:hypothetical protein
MLTNAESPHDAQARDVVVALLSAVAGRLHE